MELSKELSAWSFILCQAVPSVGKQPKAPLHHSAEPAAPREEEGQTTASEGLGEFSARATRGTQTARSSQLSDLKRKKGRDREKTDARKSRRRTVPRRLWTGQEKGGHSLPY